MRLGISKYLIAVVLTAQVIVACSGVRLPYVNYSLAAGLLAPLEAAGVRDRRGVFADLFCTVLAHENPGGRDWGEGSLYLRTKGRAGSVLPTIPATHRILVIPGIFAECLSNGPETLSQARKHLQSKHGLTVEYLGVPGLGSTSHNAGVIAKYVAEQMTHDARPYIIVGYSKGAADTMEALARYAHVRESVAALITVAGAVNGSPAVDFYAGWIRNLVVKLNKVCTDGLAVCCEEGDGGAMESLHRTARWQFLRENPKPLVPTYSLVAVSSRENTSRGLRYTWKKLLAYSSEQDGQLLVHDAIVPGADYLGMALCDHWAVALPYEHWDSAIVRSLMDKNRFPREALLEAAIRLVIRDLEEGNAGVSSHDAS